MLGANLLIIRLQRRTHVEPSLRDVGDDDVNSPSDGLHHVVRLVHCPHHQVLPRGLALRSEFLSIAGRQSAKCHRKSIAVVPEVLARNVRTVSNIRPAAIWHPGLGERQEARVPQPQDDPWRETRLPFRLRSDNFIHQGEEAVRIILWLYIDVELDVQVFGLSTR